VRARSIPLGDIDVGRFCGRTDSISLAFAFGQLWWGLTRPIAGAIADKVGAGRVLLVGAVLVATGTFTTPRAGEVDLDQQQHVPVF